MVWINAIVADVFKPGEGGTRVAPGQ